MSLKIDGPWSFGGFYTPQSSKEDSPPTPWLRNARIEANTDDHGTVTGYLKIGYRVLAILGQVTQANSDTQSAQVSLIAEGVGARYQMSGSILPKQNAISGELRCEYGDFDSRPDGASGSFIMTPVPNDQKLPIVDTGAFKIAYATRFDDVEEVLSRDDVFFVTYEKKMRAVSDGDNFFLGMQNTAEYQQDVANMRSVVRREDLAEIKKFVTSNATALVNQSDGNIDFVSDLAKRTPARWFMNYFGCVHENEDELIEWSCDLFRFVFATGNSEEFDKKALKSAAAARAFLDKTISDRKASCDEKDDILGRCLALQKSGTPRMSDVNIRNNFLGLLTGAVLTTSSSTTNAIDQLLSRPEQLAEARQAALDGDDELLARYLFEALRFNPISPGLPRLCTQRYTIAEGTERATTIEPGNLVLASSLSAMFDSTKLKHPEEFSIDRPDFRYLFFGYGLHQCFGLYISQIQIPAIAKALLRRTDLRRASGDSGQIRLDGGFPDRLLLQFNPAAPSDAPSTSPTNTNDKKNTDMSNNDPTYLNPSQNALNLVLKVKEPIAQNAAALRVVLGKLTPEGLNNVGTVHFGRFLFMDDDTKFLLFTAYDGTFEAYVNDFINETGEIFNALGQFVEHPEGVFPVQENRKGFIEFVREHDVKEEVFYCAYPKLSVLEILRNASE